MACFNETGDKRSTGQDPLRSRPAPAAADGQTLPPPPPPPQAVCFDCSICLDPAVDPVVTLCGHLYCWPCLYKWMQAETSSPKPQQCPVCKAPVSENAIVPLYGRGSLPTKHKSHLDVPARPNGGPKLRFLVPPTNITRDAIAAASMMEGQQQPRLRYGHYPAPQWGGTSMLGSTAGGGLLLGLASVAVHPLMSRSSYSTRRPYRIDADDGLRSPRERRREMMVEESLRQIWTFLFCGAVLCLLFF